MNKITKILTRSMVATALLVGWGACTDDYFDVVSEAGGGNSTQSLWQIIKQNPNLSDFAEVCAAAKYYTNEKKPSEGYTFKDLLNGQSVLTVYAPVNGTFNKDSLLEVAETNGYSLQTTFLGNHIVRFRHDIVGDSINKLLSLNGKWASIDNNKRTYRGANIIEANIPASNGVLHELDKQADFNYNIYEFLRDPQGFSKFSAYFMQGDTAYFSAGSSVVGDIIDGQTHYLDSVFYNSNNFFYGWREQSWEYTLPGMGADLSSEDSSYVMVIPTDMAYDQALSKFVSWMKYAPSYPNNVTRNSAQTSKDVAAKATFELSNPDSLTERMAPAYLMRSLVFNVNAQKGGPLVWKSSNFDQKAKAMTGAAETDYLVNTRGDTLRCLPYKTYMHGENDVICSDYADGRTWLVSDLFDGKAPKEMSNGLAYVVDNLNYDFMRTFKRDIRVEAENGMLYQAMLDDGINSLYAPKPVDSIQAKYGRVSGEYRVMYKKATSRNEFQYRLSNNVLAGKYDVFVVTVPYVVYAGEGAENELCYEFYTELNYVDKNGKEQKEKSATITTDPLKCDTILLYQDFEFPVAYMGLNDCYPTLYFRVSAKSGSKKNHNNMCIDFIYLKAKED